MIQHPVRRRILGLGVGGMLAGAALAACGGSQATGSPAAAPYRSADAPAKSKAPVSIEVLTRNGVSAPTGHSQFYAAMARERFTPETNITVNLIDAQPNVGEKLNILAAANTLPDASWFGVVADGVAGREQATKGIFKPLEPLASKDTRFDLKPYFKAMIDAFSVKGKLYALPLHAHYGTNVLYYNKNMTKAAGITVADDGNWTVDDLVGAAKKLTKRSEDIWGWWPSWGFSEYGAFWVREFGGEFLDAAGKKVQVDSPEARAGLDWVYGAQTKFQTIDDLYRAGGPGKLFEAGQLGFIAATPAEVALYRKPGQDRIKHELGVALFPKGPGGRRGTQASGSGVGITGTTKRDASWEWVKFITSKDVGITGVLTGGAGSPGGRTDVWNDPRFLAFDPIYATIIKAYPDGAGSLRLPANYHYTDLVKAVNEELTHFFKGQASLADATSKAVQAGNAILSQ